MVLTNEEIVAAPSRDLAAHVGDHVEPGLGIQVMEATRPLAVVSNHHRFKEQRVNFDPSFGSKDEETNNLTDHRGRGLREGDFPALAVSNKQVGERKPQPATCKK